VLYMVYGIIVACFLLLLVYVSSSKLQSKLSRQIDVWCDWHIDRCSKVQHITIPLEANTMMACSYLGAWLHPLVML
jgi:hypothetical protein